MFTNNEEMAKNTVGAQFHCAKAAGGSATTLPRSLAALLLGCAALLTAPQAAFADNECTPVGDDPSDNGAVPDSYTCDGPIGTYTSGVTYSSDGNLSVESTVDNNEFGGNGIRLTGNGADDVSFLADGVEIESRDLVGALLDVTTDMGDIAITTGAVDAAAHNASDVTHGIRAISSGGGNVSITTTGTVGTGLFGATDIIAIEARSLAGDVDIATDGTVRGDTYGILVEAAGGVTMAIDGSVQADNNSGIAAIDVTAGAGGLDLTIDGNIQGGRASDGWAIRAVSTGGAVIDVLGGQFGGSTFGVAHSSAVDFSGVTGGGVTMTFAGASESSGSWRTNGDSTFSDEADTLTFGGVGTNSLAHPNANNNFPNLTDEGSIDFGAGDDVFIVKDAAVFNIGNPATVIGGSTAPIVNPGASIDFGAGDDLFRLSSSADQFFQENTFIGFGAGDDTLDLASNLSLGGLTEQDGAEFDFGTGSDTFINSEIFSPNGPVVISGLEVFENTGVILLGTKDLLQFSRTDFSGSDLRGNDVLTITGPVTFTGSGDSRVVADVLLDTNTQVDCGSPTGAGDCLYMPGGTTAGVTKVTINNVSDVGILGAHNPVGVTVVDVNGGTSAADHFVLDSDSAGYVDDAVYGPAIETLGLFRYVLQYDADNQRHVMTGLPRSELFEYAVLGSAVQSVWHLTSETITDRRYDLRAGQEGAVWLRATSDHGRRDLINRYDNYGQTYLADNSYKFDTEALIGGIDMANGSGDYVDYAAGVQLGYTRSDVALNTGNSAKLSGAVVGVYGSLWSDEFFIDGTINTNFLALDNDSPLGRTTTRLESFGVHIEAGMRFDLPERFYAEPLTTLSHVDTTFEELSVEGGEILPDDTKSTRSAFGLRLGREWSGETLNGRYFITGRAWNVHDGGGDGVINNPGADVTYSDDFSGSLTQVEVGISLHNEADTISGYVSADSKSKDDYRSNNLSAGVRLRW